MLRGKGREGNGAICLWDCLRTQALIGGPTARWLVRARGEPRAPGENLTLHPRGGHEEGHKVLGTSRARERLSPIDKKISLRLVTG